MKFIKTIPRTIRFDDYVTRHLTANGFDSAFAWRLFNAYHDHMHREWIPHDVSCTPDSMAARGELMKHWLLFANIALESKALMPTQRATLLEAPQEERLISAW